MQLFAFGIVIAFGAILTTGASATCECGYTVNSTDSADAANSSFALFTELFETDFLHLYKLPTQIAQEDADHRAVGWAPQAYNVSPEAARGPFGKTAEVDNVVLNPLSSRWDWGGEGVLGGAPGLQVWVRGQDDLAPYAGGGEMVRGGEVDSLRSDIRYGSFRVGMKMADVPGTCAAFFWYRNDTQEIDLEYLSRESYPTNNTSRINLVIQSPLSASLHYNAASTATFTLHPLPFLPDASYHEYRFDWSPSLITFYLDSMPLASFDQYDPDAPGTLMLNHWSNGDPGWSGGPPARDTAITLSYVKAYFNTTNVTREDQWQEVCANSWEGRTCVIPDGGRGQGISPEGPGGNVTGRTFFFSLEGGEGSVVNQTAYPAATETPGKGDAVALGMPRGVLVLSLAAAVASGVCL